MSYQPPYGNPPGGYGGGNFPPPGGVPPLPPRGSGLVRQVRVVATLMIIHGSLICLLGLLLFVMGPAMMTLGRQDMARGGADEQAIMSVIAGVYIVLGVALLAIGALNIFAGIRNLKYRGRTLGIVAVCAGAISSLTCYCAPTAIGLLIYGLIVYLNDDVRRGFEMGEQGATPDQIKATFGYH